jgi:HD-GYP domain-containing protein (c-di-GMP phosphodiesterase class II)
MPARMHAPQRAAWQQTDPRFPEKTQNTMTKKLEHLNRRKALESLPVFVVMDYLYSKNEESPVSADKADDEKYRDLVAMFEKALDELVRNDVIEGVREIPLTSLFSVSEMVLYCLVRHEDLLYQVMVPEYRGPQFASHCVNTAFLACKIGIGVGLPFPELTELGVAALLHDIGMTKIHPAYYEHDRVLSDDERKVIETHPELGQKFLEKLEDDFPWLLRVVREEHRTMNDTAFQLEAEQEPHQYSKIVGLSDSFEAYTHQRSFRKAYHPSDAIKIIIEGRSALFDRKVLRAMIESLSLFPVGSLVQLNTNTIAEVIRTIDGSPLRPVVKILDSERTGAGGEPRIVDLSNEKNLFITGQVYDERYYIPDQAKAL